MAEIIEIGKYQLKQPRWRMTLPEGDGCRHEHLTANDHGEILTCDDCHQQVGAYWAFMRFTEQYRQMTERLNMRRKQLTDDEARGVTLRAAQKVEHAWRTHHLAPACPHCLHVILSTDGFGNTMLNKDQPEEARRNYLSTAKVLGLSTGEVR